jgi:tRNA(Ile)-lysidine synthase TilS/MesJ
VHHGLQAAADDFASHCQTLCELLGVPLVVTRVNAHHVSGESKASAWVSPTMATPDSATAHNTGCTTGAVAES